MKRWCKRPPASPETGAARQAPPGATPIGAMTRPAELQVGGNEPAGDDRPRWMAAPDRIPLIDRLKESPALQGFPIREAGLGITGASRERPRMARFEPGQPREPHGCVEGVPVAVPGVRRRLTPAERSRPSAPRWPRARQGGCRGQSASSTRQSTCRAVRSPGRDSQTPADSPLARQHKRERPLGLHCPDDRPDSASGDDQHAHVHFVHLGEFGGMCRYASGSRPRAGGAPERGTLFVNLSGATALGLLHGLGIGGSAALLIGTAGLGTYTTFPR